MNMTETELLAEVVDLLEQIPGLVWHYCGDSRRCIGHRGFPDLFVAGPHGIIVAELKSANGETSAGQDLWLWTLNRTQLARAMRIWMPRDLASGAIREDLEAIA